MRPKSCSNKRPSTGAPFCSRVPGLTVHRHRPRIVDGDPKTISPLTTSRTLTKDRMGHGRWWPRSTNGLTASAHAGSGPNLMVTFGFAPESETKRPLTICGLSFAAGSLSVLCDERRGRPSPSPARKRQFPKETALEEGPGPLRRVGRYAEITFPKRKAHRFSVNQSLLPTPRIEFTDGKRLGGKPRGPDIGH